MLSIIGVIVWLMVPAKPTSKWAARRRGEDPDKYDLQRLVAPRSQGICRAR